MVDEERITTPNSCVRHRSCVYNGDAERSARHGRRQAYLEDAMQFALEQGILRRGEYAAMLYSVEDDMFVQVAKAPPLATSMAAAT